MYKCLYNLELLIFGSAKTPFQDYDEPIRRETPANYVRQLEGTDIDALMICPTAWKRPLWRSQVDPHWEKEAPGIQQPYFTADMKYFEKVYFRWRDYMLAGNDPVAEVIAQARKQGIAPLFSYRMNDHHYLAFEKAFIHPNFWKENPQFWQGDGDRHFDYFHPEVRDYYFALLSELISLYDVDGLELDFMRSPTYFRKEQVEEGREIMTCFVTRVRDMLDSWGQKRNKRLKLCVRVPQTVQKAFDIGLDVARWSREGLIDMVNVSPSFIASTALDVEGYKKAAPNAAVYGEMNVGIDTGKRANGFVNNVVRRTTRHMYRAMAATYLDQGMDGISFFNAEYARHHFFNEPRRNHLKDGQPPHSAFRGIASLEELAKYDKHYFAGSDDGVQLPAVDQLEVDLYVADRNVSQDFRHAILRLKSRGPCENMDVAAQVNGVPVEEICWLGELFPPQSIEAIARPEEVKYYKVPTEILKHGFNRISARNLSEAGSWDKYITFTMVELGIYKNNCFMEEL